MCVLCLPWATLWDGRSNITDWWWTYKTFSNPKEWFFWESFRGEILSRNKVQLLNLASWLWLALIKFPFMKTVWNHYDFTFNHSKPCLSSSSWNYSWFMQYMNSDDRDFHNVKVPFGYALWIISPHFSLHLWCQLLCYNMVSFFCIEFCL
jgi:hypothetical protein